MTNDLTKGTIWKKLIIFAIPLLLSSLVQQLYNTVDLIYVGNLLGKNQSSAVGTSSLLITCLVGFFGGMSVGSGVVVSQAFGSKDRAKLRRAVHNTLALSIWGGLLLTVIGWFFAPHSGAHTRRDRAGGTYLSAHILFILRLNYELQYLLRRSAGVGRLKKSAHRAGNRRSSKRGYGRAISGCF